VTISSDVARQKIRHTLQERGDDVKKRSLSGEPETRGEEERMESLRGKVAIVGAADTDVGVVPQFSTIQMYVNAAKRASQKMTWTG